MTKMISNEIVEPPSDLFEETPVDFIKLLAENKHLSGKILKQIFANYDRFRM